MEERTITSGYTVTPEGEVISYRRWKHGRALKQNVGAKGYPRVSIYYGDDSTATVERVGDLVALAYLEPRPEGLWLLHHNDIKTDNRVGNLYWGTPKQNNEDCVRNGNHWQQQRTRCTNNHELTTENTVIVSRGVGRNPTKTCHICLRDRERRAEANRRTKQRSSSNQGLR